MGKLTIYLWPCSSSKNCWSLPEGSLLVSLAWSTFTSSALFIFGRDSRRLAMDQSNEHGGFTQISPTKKRWFHQQKGGIHQQKRWDLDVSPWENFWGTHHGNCSDRNEECEEWTDSAIHVGVDEPEKNSIVDWLQIFIVIHTPRESSQPNWEYKVVVFVCLKCGKSGIKPTRIWV